MSVETAFERLKQANPAPHPDELDTPPRIEAIQRITAIETEDEMTVLLPPVSHPLLSSRLRLLGAAAIAVVALGLVFVLMNNRDDVEPADRAPIETADLFMAAMSTLDVDGTTALFAEDVRLDPLAENWPALLNWYRASHWVHTPERCSEVTSLPAADSVVTIYCTYLPSNAWSEALGHEVTTPDRFVLRVQDGLIVGMENQDVGTPAETSFLPAWVAFIEWVEENHPQDLEAMFSDNGEINVSDESIALWAKNTDEFVSSLSG